jgi:hypothetical protein
LLGRGLGFNAAGQVQGAALEDGKIPGSQLHLGGSPLRFTAPGAGTPNGT